MGSREEAGGLEVGRAGLGVMDLSQLPTGLFFLGTISSLSLPFHMAVELDN